MRRAAGEVGGHAAFQIEPRKRVPTRILGRLSIGAAQVFLHAARVLELLGIEDRRDVGDRPGRRGDAGRFGHADGRRLARRRAAQGYQQRLQARSGQPAGITAPQFVPLARISSSHGLSPGRAGYWAAALAPAAAAWRRRLSIRK